MKISLGLLILRVVPAGMMLTLHGYGKLTGFGAQSGGFPDPFGVGSTLSMAFATFAEFFCSILVILGVYTRLAAVPLAVTMAVAALIIHGGDPWSKKELALLYATVFTSLIFLGPGDYTIGRWIRTKR